MQIEQKNSTEESRRRRIYATQPYHVGSKRGNSLAVIIPAGIARQCDITTDTVFSVKADTRIKAVILQTIKLTTEDEKENKKAGAVEVSETSLPPRFKIRREFHDLK
jgi:antitoxin component of MazEF toxin-antitoxin module